MKTASLIDELIMEAPDPATEQEHLIPLIDRDGVPAVDARELHQFLESKQRFNDWITYRIKNYGFEEGSDYYWKSSKTPNGGRPSTEYTISLDMAKELSMVERNDKGKEARRYFIECERKTLEAPQYCLPKTFSEALHMLADTVEEKAALESKVTEDAPKVEFYERVTESKTVCQMAVAAQVAKLPFGRNILFRKLREKGVLMSGGQRRNLPKQSYINQGLFSVEESSHTSLETDETFVSFTTHVTQKGIDWLIRHYGQEVSK